jgi:hypothetical protein
MVSDEQAIPIYHRVSSRRVTESSPREEAARE